MRNSKQIFEDELSGDPLCQEAVIYAIKLAMKEAIKESAKVAKTKLVENVLQPYGDMTVNRIVDKDSILKLINKI